MVNFSRNALVIFILAELASFLGFYFPIVMNIAFMIAVVAAIWATCKKLEYGLYIMVGELILGSKSGALLAFSVGDFFLSFRMAFFVIFLSAFVFEILRAHRWPRFFQDRLWIAYAIFGAVAAINFGRGLLNLNQAGNAFFDANGFIYFLLILPVYECLINFEIVKRLLILIGLGIQWLLIKTLLVLYFFSHAILGPREDLYHWLIDTATGQVAFIAGRFFRVFLQSQIWAMFGFFVFGALLMFYLSTTKLTIVSFVVQGAVKKSWKKRLLENYGYGALFVSSAAVVFLSFSRSIWLGVLAALTALFFYFLIIRRFKFKELVFSGLILIVLLAAIWGSVQGVVNFPYPVMEIDAGLAFSDRLSGLASQAAGSTRINQLEPLKEAIFEAPIFGYGFGKELTYTTTDPKNLLETVGGQFTTYAFEWAWLDLWLKIGLIGVLAYLVILAMLVWQCLHLAKKDFGRSEEPFWYGLAAIIAALVVIHLTTPYLNHPLGIGMIMIISAIIFLKTDPKIPNTSE